MCLEEYKDSKARKKICKQIKKPGLVDYINRLDEGGYTIVPPELEAPIEFTHLIGAIAMHRFADNKQSTAEQNVYMMNAGYSPWA